ncbi:MAG: excinuclease ABC subunit UvrC [Bacilli bacterium]
MIKEKLKLVPNQPGCYQMKDKNNTIIYVGKAKKLKNRLSSYFRGKHTGKTAYLVNEIVDFEFMVVNSEIEALILENNLIKQYDPKYNILLRDDKSYPYIELTDEEVPRLQVIRNINRKKTNNHLYGPYPNVTAAKSTVNLLNRMYPLRKCRTYSKKPCLYYHINQCLGYCTKNVSKIKIDNMRNEIIKFLKGDHSLITNKIKEEMQFESNLMHYEKAKELKELLDYIAIVLTKQQVEMGDDTDRDIFGYYTDKGYVCIQVFFVRGSKLIGKHHLIFPLIDEEIEEVTSYIANFYNKDIIKPKEILVPINIDKQLLSEYLKIKVFKPLKGPKKTLIDMAINNAKIILEENLELIKNNEAKTILANEELKKVLKLDKLDRIEIFDNSNLFGNYNVSGMVVFINGKEAKNEYRKFKISLDKNDDYGTMKEVIYRRYFRVLNENLNKPDLIIVDGGLGQINVARSVLKQLNIEIPIVGLKKDDKHLTNTLLAFDPCLEINIDKRSNLFHYLEYMQDEVHNYTINYHKQLRSKGSLESVLSSINGIGEVRKNELLKKYKTLTRLKELTKEELETILPSKIAVNLYDFLKETEL